jgi:hypothetical protein
LAQDDLIEKLNRLRGLLAHKNSDFSYAELIDCLAEMALDKVDIERKAQRKKQVKEKLEKEKSEGSFSTDGDLSGQTSKPTQMVEGPATPPAEVKPSTSARVSVKREYIPIKIRREVWARDQGMCTYKDPQTNRQCRSRFKLQYDHIQPVALGGVTEVHNLRLLCAQHNRWVAIQKLGQMKMAKYLRY